MKLEECTCKYPGSIKDTDRFKLAFELIKFKALTIIELSN
jgi:hypothetical protein